MPCKLSKAAFLLLSAAALLIGACSVGNPAAPETPALPPATAPESDPTEAPPLVIVLAAEGANAGLQAEVSQIVETFASENGYRYEARQALTVAELPPETEVVILLGPFDGADELVAAAADVRFIAIGSEGLTESQNVATISVAGATSANAAFVAGYTAAIATDDWRVGVLYGSESAALSDAFAAGVRYFCGSCDPVAPPYAEYPLAAQADPLNWQAAADTLLSQSVRTVYLAPELEALEIARFLADWGVLLIGNSAPPEGLEGSWLASVGGDASQALQQLPALLAGEQTPPADATLGLSYVNDALLSPAQQENISEIIGDLMSGYISWEAE